MQTLALQAIPKQQFTIVLDDVLYDISLLETNGCMSMNLTRAGASVCKGQRIVAGTMLLPYDMQEAGFGNFIFLTQNGQLPYYTAFTSTQQMIYGTPAELAAIRDTGELPPRNYHAGAGTAVGVAVATGGGASH